MSSENDLETRVNKILERTETSEDSHRDESFTVDDSRMAMLIQLFLTGVGKDNRKKIAQLIAKKDRRISKIQLERMQTLWNCLNEFRAMFHDKPSAVQQELHYIEPLIEILRQQANQTSGWKLVLP